MLISVIIPTYNEEKIIASAIQMIRNRAAEGPQLEIIVADGGSDDHTIAEARNEEAIVVQTSQKRRSIQMNKGARAAAGNMLYFLHADTRPPQYFNQHIKEKFREGYPAGCFQLSFDSENALLHFYGWCTRFNIDAFRFGDQSLFIKPQVFHQLGGFRDDFYVLEGHEMVKRVKKEHAFTICNPAVVTSSRKYVRNGALRLQLIYTIIVMFYKLGFDQSDLYQFYKKWVH